MKRQQRGEQHRLRVLKGDLRPSSVGRRWAGQPHMDISGNDPAPVVHGVDHLWVEDQPAHKEYERKEGKRRLALAALGEVVHRLWALTQTR